MSVARMSAGGGFRYLLRHTASADVARGQQALVDYYVESGNPPGRWLGSGLSGLADGQGLERGTQVTEAAMSAVFGRAVDPVTGTALGRAFPTKTGADGLTRASGVAGFDLTFTPVKSISVLWALGDEATRAAVAAAHRAAVDQVIAILEERVAATRVGRAGASRVAVRGVVAAAFDHPDTRTGDPNLHTHVVVANRVQAGDGVWRTLDGQQLYSAAVALSETYDALLADELHRRLPVEFGWRSSGSRRTAVHELKGFSDWLLAEFSTRSAGIAPVLEGLVARFRRWNGRGPNRVEMLRLRQAATVQSRPAKTPRAWAELLADWAKRARRVTGLSGPEVAAKALQGERLRGRRAEELSSEWRQTAAEIVVERVAERRSTWNAWNLEAEIARLLIDTPMASPQERAALHAAVLVLAQEQCIALDGRSLAATRVFDPTLGVSVAAATDTVTVPGVAADGVGVSVISSVAGTGTDARDLPGPVAPAVPGVPGAGMARRFTSARILAAEAMLLTAATTGAGPAVERGVAERAAERAMRVPWQPAWSPFQPLSQGQADAVVAATTSGRLVQVLVGPAGSGKTSTLSAIAQLWAREWRGSASVIGLAPSATAAHELGIALDGARCETVAKWLWESTGKPADERRERLADLENRWSRQPGWSRPAGGWGVEQEMKQWQFRAGQLIVVDEASLAGTLDLATLVTQAQESGAGVLLVGDQHQLSAVQAGGSFGLLARRTSTVELAELFRFRQRWEAAATHGLRAGDPRAIDSYAAHGRLHDGDRDTVLDGAYSAWRADVDAGRESLLIAADNTTVLELNARARADNVITGRASAEGIELRDGTTAGVGDRITTRLNARRLRDPDGEFVRNGATWTVQEIRDDGSLVVTPAMPAAGEQAAHRWLLPAEYVAEHVELGYAITAHRAQSRTVDTAHVITGPGMTREHLYVGMTRGRDANHTYIPLRDLDPDEPHQQLDLLDQPATGREVLAQILAASSAEPSATESMARARDPQPVVPASRPQPPEQPVDSSHDHGLSGHVLSR